MLSHLSLQPLTQAFNQVLAAQQDLNREVSDAGREWSRCQDQVRSGKTTGKPEMDWFVQAFQPQAVPLLTQSRAIYALDTLVSLVNERQGDLVAVAMIVDSHPNDPSVIEVDGYCAACGRIAGPLQFPTPDILDARLLIPVTDLWSDQDGIDQDIANYHRGRSRNGSIHLSSEFLLGEGDWTSGRQYQEEGIVIVGKKAIQQWVDKDHDGDYWENIIDNFADWTADNK